MADNTLFQASLDPAQPRIADKEVTHSGDTAKVQLIQLVEVTGSEGSYTLREMLGLDIGIAGVATANAVASGTADAQVVAATANLRLMGFSAKEDAALPAEAEFILRNGTSTAGTPLAFVTLGPNESVRDWFGPNGIAAASGIFVDRISGTTEIVVHTRVLA